MGVWNYLSGYVKIQVSGLSLERFVNAALQNGLEIWDVRRESAASITAYVSIASFLRLRKLRRAIRGIRIHILEKHGLLLLLTSLRGRYVLLFGWVVVLAMLLGASRYVWFVEVEGCDMVEESQIKAFLSDIGIEPGINRRSFITSGIGDMIEASDKRIAWASAALTGVVLRVSIREASYPPPDDASDAPADIIASRDGVIRSVTALKGRARVTAGDVVQKGDVLISGVIGNEASGAIYVRADGEVIADTVYVFSANAGPKVRKTVRSGMKSRYVELGALGMTFSSLDPPYETYETQRGREMTLKGCAVPLWVRECGCYELTDAMMTVSHSELKTLALLRAQTLISATVPGEASITGKQSRTDIREDGSAAAVITVNVREDISQVSELVVE